MKILLTIMGLLMVGCASAHADEWDTTDKTLGATALVLELLDMGQTISISKSCHSSSPQYYETNSMLGTCPSAGRVRGYFATSIALSGLIADALPSRYRKGFLASAAVVELHFVQHNMQLGISWSWK